MKPTPPGWPRMSAGVFYDDPAAAIDWLCRAFGFELRLKVEGDPGVIVHSELVYGDALIMIAAMGGAGEHKDPFIKNSPQSIGGANTQCLCIYVDDVDAHCAHAVSCGAKLTRPPTTSDYGEDYWVDRAYGCLDLEEHNWWFMQRLSASKQT
jgi:uncharacterized glyoxalase superfamily protein PhnB